MSSLYEAPFTIDGLDYKSVEHFYQANKFHGYKQETFDRVISAKTPGSAKKLAGMAERQDKKDPSTKERWNVWHTNKDQVMKRAFQAKFD